MKKFTKTIQRTPRSSLASFPNCLHFTTFVLSLSPSAYVQYILHCHFFSGQLMGNLLWCPFLLKYCSVCFPKSGHSPTKLPTHHRKQEIYSDWLLWPSVKSIYFSNYLHQVFFPFDPRWHPRSCSSFSSDVTLSLEQFFNLPLPFMSLMFKK